MNAHNWKYVGGHYDCLWFYCTKCGEKRTYEGGMFTIPEFRLKHIKETEGETSGGCKMNTYKDELLRPFEGGEDIVKKVEIQYTTLTCPNCVAPIKVPLNYISSTTKERLEMEYKTKLEKHKTTLEKYKNRLEECERNLKVYRNLRECFSGLIKPILGDNYYTMAMDWCGSDKEICDDIKYKFKVLKDTITFFRWTTAISTTSLILVLIWGLTK